MLKYKRCLPGCFAMLVSIVINAQTMKPGDQVKDIQMKNVVYYDRPQVSLSDYKGKNIILELWSKTCVVCIKSFPKLVEFQKLYKDKLQIIAVNSDAKEETKKILQRQKVPANVIPFVTEDKTINKLFPRNYNPWIVWIDNKGIVKYISDGQWVNDDNIRLFVKGEKPKLVQNVFIETPKTVLPLFAVDNGKWADRVMYYSYLSHCINGLSVHNLTLLDTNQNFWITRNCKSVIELFQDAFGEGIYNRFVHSNRVILNLRDPYPYMRPKEKDSGWFNRFSYNYEISISPSKGKSIYKMMQEDLQRIFNITAQVRQEKIQCLLLIRTDSIDRIGTTGGTSVNKLVLSSSQEKVFAKNIPFTDFVYRLQSLLNPDNSNAPLIDVTGYRSNIDIEIDKEVFEKPDLLSLKKALNPLGLDVVMRNFETETLVITEN
jgi:thiol-disulfide isomerase/thioredoxin